MYRKTEKVCPTPLTLTSPPYSNDPHAWVMTINEKCDTILFWEIGNNKCYELGNGRISSPEKLSEYLMTCTHP